MASILEKNGSGYDKYDAVFVEPEKLSALSNSIAMKILKSLSESPKCAMDISRELDLHEQKVYYHLNKLQRSDLVKLIGTEKRYGMVAQMYDVVSPVVAAKLHDNGLEKVEKPDNIEDPELMDFFKDFVSNGKLNSKLVIGDPYPHGKYNTGSNSHTYAFDFTMMLGRIVRDPEFPSYELDINVTDKDMLNNLIIIGSPKENTICQKLNEELDIFDEENDFGIKGEKELYDDPRIGVIAKCDNPRNVGDKILIMAGVRSRGMRAASLAVSKYFDKFTEGINLKENFVRIVEGIDEDGDGVIDSVKILE